MSQCWGRPAAEAGTGWAVVDVETTGFRPGQARVVSVAALAVGDDGSVEHSVSSLLNPGVDPGPTHVHGLTAEMLEGQPTFGDIVGDLIELLRGRTLVAHRLDLGTENLRLETLARHWGATQLRPHDALDDALVLAQILKPALVQARERKSWLPIRSVSRRIWPNGHITHDELRPLKVLAARLPCDHLNPGLYVAGRPLVQGMRIALSAEMTHTHEEVIERILDAGLAYAENVDQQTSLVVCNDAAPAQGKGYQAVEQGIPLMGDAEFMALIGQAVGGTDVEQFADTTGDGDQYALF